MRSNIPAHAGMFSAEKTAEAASRAGPAPREAGRPWGTTKGGGFYEAYFHLFFLPIFVFRPLSRRKMSRMWVHPAPGVVIFKKRARGFSVTCIREESARYASLKENS